MSTETPSAAPRQTLSVTEPGDTPSAARERGSVGPEVAQVLFEHRTLVHADIGDQVLHQCEQSSAALALSGAALQDLQQG